MRSVSFCLLILGLQSFLIGCGSIKDMKSNAKKASDNSGRAAVAAEESREEIANSRLMARKSAASKSRSDALKDLIEAGSFDHKATMAAKYLKAFEYNLWTGQRYDTAEYLEELYKDGLEEFYRSLVEINEGESLDEYELTPFPLDVPFGITNNLKKNLSIYAVAAALHKTSAYADLMFDDANEVSPPLSFFELISRALVSIRRYEASEINYEDLKSHEKVVFRYRAETHALMQARINILLVIGLKTSSKALDSKIRVAQVKYLGAKNSSLKNSNFSQINTALKVYVLKAMEYAANTASLLETEGLSVEVSDDLLEQYKTLDFSNDLDVLTNKESSQENRERVEKYLDYIDVLKLNRTPEENAALKMKQEQEEKWFRKTDF